jgi:hypothetical protein
VLYKFVGLLEQSTGIIASEGPMRVLEECILDAQTCDVAAIVSDM